MRSFISTAALALAASSAVSAAPAAHKSSTGGLVQLPLGDGFPKPSANQLKQIEKNAFGTLSNLPPPPKLSDDTLTSLRLVAFNENWESFFFANVLRKLDDAHFMRTLGELRVTKEVLKTSIESMLAVEELHSINANNALVKVGKVAPIAPCKYVFPVDDIKSAIVLAARFTDVVMGTLADVVVDAATAGDAGFTRGVVASAEDEGEQEGGFRLWLGNNRPQSQPFLTAGVRDYAFSVLQDFIVPGSCPNENEIDLTVFQPLTANDPKARNQDIEFSFSLKPTRYVPSASTKGKELISTSKLNGFHSTYSHGSAWKGLYITYINGQNIISEPLKGAPKFDGEKITVKAFFPQEQNDIFGLTLAVLTDKKDFTTFAEVEAATLFGPAPLEVQE
jgi:hypothetical protein